MKSGYDWDRIGWSDEIKGHREKKEEETKLQKEYKSVVNQD